MDWANKKRKRKRSKYRDFSKNQRRFELKEEKLNWTGKKKNKADCKTKTAFKTKAQAEKAIEKTATVKKEGRNWRVYRCDFCGRYHLTSGKRDENYRQGAYQGDND